MGSYSSPKRFYNSDDLDQLQWVWETVWFIFQTRYPHRDTANDEPLKASLGRKLFTFASAGLNDLEGLETNLINSIPADYDLAEHLEAKKEHDEGERQSKAEFFTHWLWSHGWNEADVNAIKSLMETGKRHPGDSIAMGYISNALPRPSADGLFKEPSLMPLIISIGLVLTGLTLLILNVT